MEFLKNLKYAWKFTRDQKWQLVKYIISCIFGIGVSVLVPVMGAKIIVYFTSSMYKQVIYTGLLIFLVENVRNVVNCLSRKYATTIYRESFSKIQIELGKNILKLQNSVLDQNGSGVFIQRMTGDADNLADVFNVLTMYITGIMTDLGIFGAIFVIDKRIFCYMVVMLLIIYFIEKSRANKRSVLDKEYRKQRERVTGFIGEVVRGARDIKMLNAERSFIDNLQNRIISVNESRYRMNGSDNRYRLILNIGHDIFDLGLILLSVGLVSINSLSVANALIIHNYSGRISSIIYSYGQLLNNIKDFNLSAMRIFAIIKGEEFPKEEFGTEHLEKIKGDFEFKNVKFSYDKEKVLNGVSFKIKANETVAFVGKSGAGKTTIFNLLCKMYEPTSGKITIDGVDIRKLDKDSIRGNITIISQNPYIFNLSIKENLKLVKEDLTDEEMYEACKVACLDEFIQNLPDKYDTLIGEGGVNLSGGQKQRLAIARALVQKTEIILFDEATSALDNETQAKIQEAIENMKNEYTILIIAHRLSTIVNANRIVFLNDGKIEIEGTHDELLEKSKAYRHLYESEIRK